MRAPAEYADITADVLARIRSRAPRVHCITNSVAQAYTANMLLAAGAIPSMTISPEEIAAFVAGADALFERLKINPKGDERVRTAVLAMRVCSRAWKVARRAEPHRVPSDNPF